MIYVGSVAYKHENTTKKCRARRFIDKTIAMLIYFIRGNKGMEIASANQFYFTMHANGFERDEKREREK